MDTNEDVPTANVSKSAYGRLEGKHQIEEQRRNILQTAEQLFLRNGIESTNMIDIARNAGITKVTLYRYYPNREEIAVELQIKMIKKIQSSINFKHQGNSLEAAGRLVRTMTEKYDELKDAYRYIGLFDRAYLDYPCENPGTGDIKKKLHDLMWEKRLELPSDDPYIKQSTMLTNTVIWFFEKIAMRGELTWGPPDVSLSENMRLFEDMILKYIDSLQN